MLATLVPTLVALLSPLLSAALPPPSPPSPALRPLALYLQQRSDAANAIPGRGGGGRYGAGRQDSPHDKPVAFPGNWMFPSTPSVSKTPTTTPPVSPDNKETSRSGVGNGSKSLSQQDDTETDTSAGTKNNLPADDSFSQVFAENNVVLEPPQMSRCVWAIVTCCSPGSRSVRYGCFEQLGCHGAFWGTSPCDRHIARSAIQAALKFYL